MKYENDYFLEGDRKRKNGSENMPAEKKPLFSKGRFVPSCAVLCKIRLCGRSENFSRERVFYRRGDRATIGVA